MKTPRSFRVTVTAFATVFVEADDPDDAMQIAMENLQAGDMETDEASVKEELTGNAAAIERCRRHAEKVMEYYEYH